MNRYQLLILVVLLLATGDHLRAQIQAGREGVLQKARANVIDDVAGVTWLLDLDGNVRITGLLSVEGATDITTGGTTIPNVLNDLDDVTITSPSPGEVLTYSGGMWGPGAGSGALLTLWYLDSQHNLRVNHGAGYAMFTLGGDEVARMWFNGLLQLKGSLLEEEPPGMAATSTLFTWNVGRSALRIAHGVPGALTERMELDSNGDLWIDTIIEEGYETSPTVSIIPAWNEYGMRMMDEGSGTTTTLIVRAVEEEVTF